MKPLRFKARVLGTLKAILPDRSGKEIQK